MKLSKSFYYRVKREDCIASIIRNFNTSNEGIIRNNTELPLYPGEWIKISPYDYHSHKVKPMEKLEDIAAQYSISLEKLRQDNNLSIDKLYIGQTLKIYN